MSAYLAVHWPDYLSIGGYFAGFASSLLSA